MSAPAARRKHLGVGWRFPLAIGPTGGFQYASDEEDVREAIWIILATAPGERQMRPRFGCGIHDLVFAAINAATLGELSTRVRSALIEWEPRIDLLDVGIEAPPGQESTLLIRVDYRIRSSNAFHNLVYPFYITEGTTA